MVYMAEGIQRRHYNKMDKMTNLDYIREKITADDIAYLLDKTQCMDVGQCELCALREACDVFASANNSKKAVIRWLKTPHHEDGGRNM